MNPDWFSRYEVTYGDFRRPISSVCRKVSAVDLAGDVLQTALLELTSWINREPDKFATKDDLIRYAIKIAKHEVVRLLQMRQKSLTVDPSTLANDESNEVPTAEQLLLPLKDAPPEVQEAMRLYYFEGVQGRAIAKKLGCSVTKVSRLIRLGKTIIKKAFGDSFGLD